MLRARRAAVAWTEWRDLPRVAEITTDFLYLRWLGDRRELSRYDHVQIDRESSFVAWEQDLRRVLPEVREIYGYFNNHWAGHSPASANEPTSVCSGRTRRCRSRVVIIVPLPTTSAGGVMFDW